MTTTFEYELEFIGPDDVFCMVCAEVSDKYHEGTDNYPGHSENQGWRINGYYDEEGNKLPKRPSWLDIATIESAVFEVHS